MQKATATAKEAGLSFEWLGSYIATLSEKTRQAPESIGTALNSLMTRIHAIRKTGYNDEDETNINDVNRALAEIGVTLMDQNGHWRDLNLVFDDVAAQWNTMTDKQKAYVSTTMAGTRQANYFKTLMQDLSKGVEGGSRAWELYEGAMNSAGTAMEKYAIWEESIEAAQNRLTAEMEEFYSILGGQAIKNWYDALAGIVGSINATTEATGGMNIAMGAGAAAVTMLVFAFMKLNAEAGVANVSLGKQIVTAITGVQTTAAGATVTTNMLGMALRSVGVGLAIAGVVQLVTWLIELRDNAEEAAKETAELASTLRDGFAQNDELNKFSVSLKDIEGSTENASDQIAEFNNLRKQMISAFPEIESRLSKEVSNVNELGSAYDNAKAALEELQKEQMYDDWSTAHEGAYTAAVSYDNALKKRSSDSEKRFIDDMRELTNGDISDLMNQYGGYAALTMKSVEGLSAQSKLLQKALGRSSDELIEQAEAFGLICDSVEDVKIELQAYIAEQERLARDANQEKTRSWAQQQVDDANELLMGIEVYENYLYKLTADIQPKLQQLQSEIATELQNSITTLVTDALNPYRFGAIPVNILTSIRQSLINMDWGDATALEIQEQATHIVSAYYKQFGEAFEYSELLQTEGLTESVVKQVSKAYADLQKEF